MDVAVRTTKLEAIAALGGTVQGATIFEIVGLTVGTKQHVDAKKTKYREQGLCDAGY